MPEGWPIFAAEAERKKLPWYGGNNIPDSYLDRFNATMNCYKEDKSGLPSGIADFAKDI